MIFEVPSTLVFYDFMILFHQSNDVNLLRKQLLSGHNYIHVALCKPIWASNELRNTLHPFVGIPTIFFSFHV